MALPSKDIVPYVKAVKVANATLLQHCYGEFLICQLVFRIV
jgi:hypothetical protein